MEYLPLSSDNTFGRHEPGIFRKNDCWVKFMAIPVRTINQEKSAAGVGSSPHLKLLAPPLFFVNPPATFRVYRGQALEM
ncbi:MAG TPA: hypothetical protein DCE56_04205 [Cyanobacteria bacterium UBA8553]|nr:hypothetical protein [Cyanobacteria bacterium UBA8553]